MREKVEQVALRDLIRLPLAAGHQRRVLINAISFSSNERVLRFLLLSGLIIRLQIGGRYGGYSRSYSGNQRICLLLPKKRRTLAPRARELLVR